MFTGIVQETGTVYGKIPKAGYTVLRITSEKIYDKVSSGDSVCINGVCLTLTSKSRGTLEFGVVEHTLKNTDLKFLRNNDLVNLEPPLKAGDMISGHIVTGHVDRVLKIRRIIKGSKTSRFVLSLPEEFKMLVFPRASICLDGISLTVADLNKREFTVEIIPFTLDNTNLRVKRTGDFLNVEFDYLLKGLQSILGHKLNK